MKRIQLLISLLVILSMSINAKVIYVDGKATGLSDGTSWTNAYGDFQNGLDFALAEDEIWLAEGTYIPLLEYDIDLSGGSDAREVTFLIPDSVAVYGGFIGTETMLSDRDFRKYITILDGDIGVKGDSSDNAYHVVATIDVSSSTSMDGITIKNGYADKLGGNNLNYFGAGWFNITSGSTTSSPSLENMIFTENHAVGSGGGMTNWAQNGGTMEPSYLNCIFSYNRAQTGGAAIHNTGYSLGQADMTAINCLFIHNDGTGGNGGAIHNDGRLTGQSNASIVNCTFYDNTSGQGGDMYNDANSNGTSNAFVRNSIHWNNSVGTFYNAFNSSTDVAYSIISEKTVSTGTTAGGGMLFATAPTFVDSLKDDFRLDTSSAGFNAGDNASNSTANDLAGKTRILNGNINMGAYEASLCVASSSTQNISACDSLVSPSGKYVWGSDNTYMDTLQNAEGCDSILTINLSITVVDTSTNQSSDTLAALAAGVKYQWINCADSMPFPADTDQVFIATQIGSFAVVVTKDGCSDTSVCMVVTNITSIKEGGLTYEIYPNPNSGHFGLSLTFDSRIVVVNILGEQVYNKFLTTGNHSIDIQKEDKGVYFLSIINGEGTYWTEKIFLH